MTLEERLALAREIAARTTPRFMIDTTREEMRQKNFRESKLRTEALKNAENLSWENLSGKAGRSQPKAPRSRSGRSFLKRGCLENYKATPERQNAFARERPSELIVSWSILRRPTAPQPEPPAPRKPKEKR
jgi:hypothetical protein